jgi:hypothetical protein
MLAPLLDARRPFSIRHYHFPFRAGRVKQNGIVRLVPQLVSPIPEVILADVKWQAVGLFLQSSMRRKGPTVP